MGLRMPDITHKLFLDDSGNKEYDPAATYAKGGGRTPYFVFGGLLLRPEVAGMLGAAVESLKVDAFGTSEVEIKAYWLKNPDQRRKRYLDPYGVSAQQMDELSKGLYAVICDHELELVACVVNKAEVQQKYTLEKAWYAPAIAYECVVQRVQHSMEQCGGYTHVTIDDMDGKSPKGNDWRANLEAQHKQLRTRGSSLIKGMELDRIVGDKPVFRDSAHDDRLQLADLVAYSVYRQFVDHGPDWEQEGKPLPVYDYLDRICHKFRNQNGRVQGFGIVKFPLNKRVRWVARK